MDRQTILDAFIARRPAGLTKASFTHVDHECEDEPWPSYHDTAEEAVDAFMRDVEESEIEDDQFDLTPMFYNGLEAKDGHFAWYVLEWV